ncbi:3-5 exonuclease family protein [Stylonychia lemnae]|uniref:3-5 exonuclease family protein n=1 Tax=Stylonychia lemnae TaxID=5949 RepID=A0A078AP16_STYLE|nr:3-5 exonuclease family protein [Stylonychia lemnae]|eukprot:CDW82708.1 3-5 exonuclease family protein [Stylonychia lemnae]
MLYIVFPSILIILLFIYRLQKRRVSKEIQSQIRSDKVNRLSSQLHFPAKQNEHSIKIQQIKYNIENACVVNYNTNKDQEFNYKITEKVPFKEFNARLYQYIDSADKLQEILQNLYRYNVLGIDLENHHLNSYNGFLCLIQITTPNYETYLIDCLKLREDVKTYLGAIFESSNTLKVFHGCVNSDIAWLQRDFGFATVNVFDTQEAYKKLFKGQRVSLLHLWQTYCKDRVKITKDQKNQFQQADWSARPLTKEMLDYAAHDSHYLIYIALRLQQNFENQNKLQELDEVCKEVNEKTVNAKYALRQDQFKPDETYKVQFRKIVDGFDPNNEEFLKIEFIFKGIYNLRENIAEQVDKNPDELCDISTLYLLSTKKPLSYIETRKVLDEAGKQTNSIFRQVIENFCIEIQQRLDDFPKNMDAMIQHYKSQPNQGLNSQQERLRLKEERKKKIIKHYSCKKVVYENCKMFSPDGELLSNCDFKKAQWYIERELADQISSDPFTIKLRFEPNGRGQPKPLEELYDDNFYVTDRENKCVNCGSEKDYSRFHVIPTLYRQSFPDELKSHRSHDVVLLCFTCHEKASREQDNLKKQLAEKYNIPLNDHNPNKLINLHIQQINRVASTLKKASFRLPDEKRATLQKNLIELFLEKKEQLLPLIPDDLKGVIETEEINNEFIMFCYNLPPTRLSNKDKQNPHGKILVDKILGEDRMSDFIKLWRTHFIKTMEPKFLPWGWSVDHTIERSFGVFSKFARKEDEQENHK